MTNVTRTIHKPFSQFKSSFEAFECAWAHERVEIVNEDGWETDVGGNPIWGSYNRHDTGKSVGNWGCDGFRLVFPDGTEVIFD